MSKPMTADEALAVLREAKSFFSVAHPNYDTAEKIEQAIAALIAERDALRKSLKEYRRLHDFISDAIEGGRLTEADVPDDYHAFIHQLEECARLEYFANQAIDAARAESGSHE